MRFAVALLMLLCLTACGPRLGIQGPERTAPAAKEKMDMLMSRSDRDIPRILLTEMGVHEATVVGVTQNEEGKKVTHVRWSHEYVTVSSHKVTTSKEVEAPQEVKIGKPTTDKAEVQTVAVTKTEYTREHTTRPCDVYAISDNGFIESVKAEGEGCVW